MSEVPDRDAFHALDRRIVELEGHMSTMQAQYAGALERFGRQTDTALERFRADFAGLKEDMAKRDGSLKEDMAKRETRQLVYVLGALAVAVAFLSLTLKPDPQTAVQPAQPPVIIQTAPFPTQIPAEARADSEGLPDATAAEPSAPSAEKQPDG